MFRCWWKKKLTKTVKSIFFEFPRFFDRDLKREFIPHVIKSVFQRISSFRADENCTSIILISKNTKLVGRKFIRKWNIAERCELKLLCIIARTRTMEPVRTIQMRVRINVDPTFHYYTSYIFMRCFSFVSH